MENASDNIPAQVEGVQTDVIHIVGARNVAEAHHLFLLVKSRLKDVSQWHDYAGPMSADFAIKDSQGNNIYKFAEVGDLMTIDVPGPGPLAGDGLEWVRIEAIDDFTDENAESEYITMTIRPVANPKHPDKAIAHFFGHNATSTFIIERYLNHVSAAVHGRNETANNTDTNLFDTVRNTIIALSAREGLSAPHWKSFVEGILEK